MSLKHILQDLVADDPTEPNEPVTDLTIPCMDELGRCIETGCNDFSTVEDSCVIPPRRKNRRALSDQRELNRHEFPSFE